MLTPTTQLVLGTQQYDYDLKWSESVDGAAVVTEAISVKARLMATGTDGETYAIGLATELVDDSDRPGLLANIPTYKTLIQSQITTTGKAPAAPYLIRVARMPQLNAGGVRTLSFSIYCRPYTIAGSVATLGAEVCVFTTNDLNTTASSDKNATRKAIAAAILAAEPGLNTLLQALVTAKGL